MAFDCFLKIDGIEGESTDQGHEKQIEVLSFHWGVSQTGTMAFGGGGGAGKAQFNDFNFSANMSKASPRLFIACASGKHIPEATLTGRRAGGEGSSQDFLVIKMNDVLISSYQTGGSQGDSQPMDQVSMAYAKIEFTYKTQDAAGRPSETVKEGWDLKANKKL